MAFISLGLFLAALFLYVRAVKKQRMLKASSEIRNHIARDLHDDIGATLTSISFYTQAAQTKLALKKIDDVAQLIDQAGQNAREAIANMNDIVWVINPKNDSVKALFERIEDFGSKLFAEANIHFYFYFKDEDALQTLTIEQRKHIYLLCKEALNNCAKYSKANNVELLIDKHAIIIKDDGVGFDMNQETSGNGLLNIKLRAHQLGATHELISQPSGGTFIKLTFLKAI
jgi:signal transduction histidine kinase